MPLLPQPAEPQKTEVTAEAQTPPAETPVLEAAPVPETTPEKGKEVFVEGEPMPAIAAPVVEHPPETPASLPVAVAPLIETPKDPVQEKIDAIFERNVGDAFAELQPLQQEAFRVAAEQAAAAVRALLSAPKLEPPKIRDVVAGVLRLLPETNPWWVEQEAALKTQALLALRA